MKIDEATYKRMPQHLQRLFVQLPNPGSDEVVGLFPVTKSGMMRPNTERHSRSMYGQGNGAPTERGTFGDSGSAARFFYCAKSSRKERDAGCEGMEERRRSVEYGSMRLRECSVCGCRTKPPHFIGGDSRPWPTCGHDDWRWAEQKSTAHKGASRNHHPTVKPLALMEYLCKLTRTPTGGVVLDPFMGSGSTGVACVNTDRDFIGIEISEEYFRIAEARIAHAQVQPAQMRMEDMA